MSRTGKRLLCVVNECVFRIVRAFLIEEVKQMKRLMQQKEKSTKKSKKTVEEKAEMSFLDHLETLRWHIIKSFISISL